MRKIKGSVPTIKGIRELFHTGLHRALIIGLSGMADAADQRTVSAARSKPIEDVRYQAGVADGIRLVMDALQPKDEDASREALP